MKLKLDENGFAVLSDGKPVYIHDDGKEIAFDAPGTIATISRLNGEAKGHRERAERAEAALKGFEGIEDPAMAKKAMETLKNLDAKKLVDAGEVEKVRAEAIKAVEEKYAPIVQKAELLEKALVAEKVGGSFIRSKFIAEKLAIPADLVEARFGQAFRVEDGVVTAYDQSGNKLYSRIKPGGAAGFDEALEMLVDAYPYRDQILKGSGASGGGAAGGGNGGRQTSKQITRSVFDGMAPEKQMAHIKGGGEVVDG